MAKNYEEGSLADFAMKGLKNIQNLSGSAKLSEKLIGFNSLLFVAFISFNIFKFINTGEVFSFSGLFIFGISIFFGLILSLAYTPIITTIYNFYGENKISALRLGIAIMSISIPLIVLDITYSFNLIKIAWLFLALQFGGLLLLGWTRKPQEKKIKDEKLRGFNWDMLGKIGTISSILSLILAIVLLFIK